MYLLCHRHEPAECPVAFAAWKGFDSPLRDGKAVGSCARGGHSLWWKVMANDEASALAQLPPFVAARAEAVAVTELPIP